MAEQHGKGGTNLIWWGVILLLIVFWGGVCLGPPFMRHAVFAIGEYLLSLVK
jgi:hypothetical protein